MGAIREGQIKAIAVARREAQAQPPNVGTVLEASMPGAEATRGSAW